MGMFSHSWELEVYDLKEEIKELKEVIDWLQPGDRTIDSLIREYRIYKQENDLS